MPTRPFKQARAPGGEVTLASLSNANLWSRRWKGSQPCKRSVIRTTEAGFKEAGAPRVGDFQKGAEG